MSDLEFYPWAVLLTCSIVGVLAWTWPISGFVVAGLAVSIVWPWWRFWRETGSTK